MNTCTKCGALKRLEDFPSAKRRTNGRRSDCKACHAAHVAARRNADPETHRISRRRYDSENRERERARQAAWREANRSKERERHARTAKDRPHYSWASNYRERAKRFGFEVIAEDFARADVIAAYGDACAHCGGIFEELDHYPVPVAHGGAHTLSNVRPSCGPCNRSMSGVRRFS